MSADHTPGGAARTAYPAVPELGPPPAPPVVPQSANATLVTVFAVGAAVAIALGVYGRVHEPTLIAVNLAGFSGPLAAKAWLATGAAAFAIIQLLSALALYGRLPGVPAGAYLGVAHRWSGRFAFLLAVPVAIHCLYAVGFDSSTPRALIHSLLGCFFFGAFTVKMLVLTRKGMPGWALPILGGLVFTGLAVLWLTSSLWFFTTVGVTF